MILQFLIVVLLLIIFIYILRDQEIIKSKWKELTNKETKETEKLTQTTTKQQPVSQEYIDSYMSSTEDFLKSQLPSDIFDDHKKYVQSTTYGSEGIHGTITRNKNVIREPDPPNQVVGIAFRPINVPNTGFISSQTIDTNHDGLRGTKNYLS